MRELKSKPLDLGQFPQRLRTKPVAHLAEWFAGALAVVWTVAVLGYALSTPAMMRSSSGVLLVLLVVFLPLALIFAALLTLRSVRALRAEAARLQASVDAMRKAFVGGSAAINPAMQPHVARKLEELAASARETQDVVASLANRSAPAPKRLPNPPSLYPASDQPALALGTPAGALSPPLGIADFIRAVNFPSGPEDEEGFRALRAALENRDVARLIRAAQDVLTLLAQDGIYMDELKHDRAHPDMWRHFARGARGRAVAGLGAVRDRAALTLTAGRLREDAAFREAVHQFLRAFDLCFAPFEHTASDDDLQDFSATRSARAFMLLGRVMGAFD